MAEATPSVERGAAAVDPKDRELLSIVYASSASASFTDQDLTDLLSRSRASNEHDGLTGLLVYRAGRFLQLLEGPEEAVRTRMRVIESDPRHGDIRVLLEDQVTARQFPDWTMGYRATTPDAGDLPGYRRTFDDIDADRTVSGTLPALRALLGWYRDQHDAR